MSFNELGVDERLIERLTQSIQSDHVSQAYIFEGEALLDKKAFAKAFAKAILCQDKPAKGCDRCAICRKIDHDNHEDMIYVEADGTSVKDEMIEMLQGRLRTRPLGARNIAVISDADTMTPKAQNRLLKTLEEPPEGAVLILLSENIENLVQTILSRCVKYHLHYFNKESDEDILQVARDVADMLLGKAPFYRVKRAIEDMTKDDKKAGAFLDGLQMVYRDLLLGTDAKSRVYKKTQIYNYVAAIEETRRQLNRGVAKSYALKNLMIKIGG